MQNRLPPQRENYHFWHRTTQAAQGRQHSVSWIPSHGKGQDTWTPPWGFSAAQCRRLNEIADECCTAACKTGSGPAVAHGKLVECAEQWASKALGALLQAANVFRDRVLQHIDDPMGVVQPMEPMEEPDLVHESEVFEVEQFQFVEPQMPDSDREADEEAAHFLHDSPPPQKKIRLAEPAEPQCKRQRHA